MSKDENKIHSDVDEEGMDTETQEISTVVSTSAIEAISRVEVDSAMEFATRHPRSIQRFIQDATDMATIDEETAESCIYCREVGKKWNPVTRLRESEYAEGLSIRFAEIAVPAYRNIRWYPMVIEMLPEYVRARAIVIDLERNVWGASEAIECTLKKDGTPYTPRMRTVMAKKACAIAMRDAVWKVIPPAMLKPVERKIREIIGGSTSILTLQKRRNRVVSWIGKLGIDVNRVWSSLGITGEADMNSEILVRLSAIKTSISEDVMTLDEAFPFVESGQQPGQQVAGTRTKVSPLKTADKVEAIKAIKSIEELENFAVDWAESYKIYTEGQQKIINSAFSQKRSQLINTATGEITATLEVPPADKPAGKAPVLKPGQTDSQYWQEDSILNVARRNGWIKADALAYVAATYDGKDPWQIESTTAEVVKQYFREHPMGEKAKSLNTEAEQTALGVQV